MRGLPWKRSRGHWRDRLPGRNGGSYWPRIRQLLHMYLDNSVSYFCGFLVAAKVAFTLTADTLDGTAVLQYNGNGKESGLGT